MNDAAVRSNTDPRGGLPSVDDLIRSPAARSLLVLTGERFLSDLCRKALEECRNELTHGMASGQAEKGFPDIHTLAEEKLNAFVTSFFAPRQSRVINATGVVVHTNLGRAPLSDAAKEAIFEAAGYSSVEMNVGDGKRGRRGGFAEDLICKLTGAEAAVIVNNCAAAAFLVLSVLAKDKEVIVSRGELVEIGGDFRVPDVLERSGAHLREVGTTNRTKLADYATAIGDDTGLILRVHPSNYKIIGFTASPSNAELGGLAHENGLIFFEDAGSGALIDLSQYGLGDEPVIARSIADGADIVSFSGDKLLGGPQSGLIVGRKDLIETIRRHPLFRALRASKLIYAGLQATLEAYVRETAFTETPVLRMIAATLEEIHERSLKFLKRFEVQVGASSKLDLALIDGVSVIGGGSAPGVQPATHLISVEFAGLEADAVSARLRSNRIPVFGRIVNDRFLIDLRTVAVSEENELFDAIKKLSI